LIIDGHSTSKHLLWHENLCKLGLVSPTPLMNGYLNSLSAFID